MKEDLRICLVGVKTLQQKGCDVKIQWSPFHTGIHINRQVDTLNTNVQIKMLYRPTKTSIAWLRIQAYQTLMEEWKNLRPNPTIPLSKKSNNPLYWLPRYQATNMLRVWYQMTDHDESFNKPSPQSECGKILSTKHTILECHPWTYKTTKLSDKQITRDTLLKTQLSYHNQSIYLTGMTTNQKHKDFRESI